MGNFFFQKNDTSLPIQKELKTFEFNYIFYFQSNSNPFDENQIKKWERYDTINQNNLNLKYEFYLKNKKIFCFPLLHPYDKYNVDFKEMKQIHQIDTLKKLNIKVEKLQKEDFQFFWKANKDPWNEKEEPIWVPYDEEDQSVLIEAYNNFLLDDFRNIADLKKPAYHFINFSKMIQINKHDTIKQRQVQRCHPKLVTNILRKNRFSTSYKKYSFKPDFIEQQTLNHNDFKNFFRKNNEIKKINKIYFKVFPEFHCELDIEQQLCFFQDNFSIEVSLEEIKSILIKEIYDLAKHDGHSEAKINTANKYKKEIEKINDCESFFDKIVYIYTMEGYLYKKLNHFLRNMNKSAFEKIKYYYTCLLSCFQYINENTELNNNNEDIIVYRASKFSDEEYNAYQAKDNTNIIRIFKEFLSTSMDIETTENFLEKDNENIKEFLWEIKIPKYIIKNEPYNFADISNKSKYVDEQEILIRSGAIIQIDEIIPYTREIGIKKVTYKNKFLKLCTLRSFSIASFFKLFSLDPLIKELNLSLNDLGKNVNNMLYLKEALQSSNSIQKLDLSDNILDFNKKNMFYLKEGLQNNNSIQILNLSWNKLGSNERDILYLKEGLLNNKSIKILNLSSNKLGSNEMNMVHLKEALQKNNSIQILNISSNKLGSNERDVQNLKEALLINKSIIELDLRDNNLCSNERDVQNLKEALQIKNSITNFYG